MNMTCLHEVFDELRNSVIIVNKAKEILWLNSWAKEILRNENVSINCNFDDLFEFEKKDKKKFYVHLLNGEKFYYKLFSLNSEIDVILLYSRDSFREDYNKIYCYEKIVNMINDGILLTDYKGHVKIFNPSQERMENKKFKDLYDKYLWDFYDYDNEEQSEHRKVYKEKVPVLDKYRLLTYKNGQPRYLYYSTYPILKDENVVGVFSVSKNEEKLGELLSETIELKRKLASIEVNEENHEVLGNGTTYTFTDIVGNSEKLRDTIKEAQTMALLNKSVLIVGETGTGKEMFAQSIHNYVNKSEPFVAINCAAIPENLLESILFGSVKGAYTGASDSIGLFEASGKGTLLLDELNSMPVPMQTKLLRVLQEKKIRRVGDSKMYPIYCRVISAINEDPKELVEKGLLRKDLFFRISGLVLNIPPLRERKDDIKYMMEYFIQKNNRIMKKNVAIISKSLENILINYSWPGNVRELEYVVENLMIKVKSNSNILTLDDLPSHIHDTLNSNIINNNVKIENRLLNDALNEVEKTMILQALDETGWNITHASSKLGIIRQSLLYRMKRLNIVKSK
ncbi:MAG: sigma-54 interaction domain-containing protein [Sedimentibacter sp.]